MQVRQYFVISQETKNSVVFLSISFVLIIVFYFIVIPILIGLLTPEKKVEQEYFCEDGFLVFKESDSQWLCGNCKIIVYGNQEYNCELTYKPAIKKD